jgi:hypothetical protein
MSFGEHNQISYMEKGGGIDRRNIAVIMSYQEQREELFILLNVRVVDWANAATYLDTVDSMQGGEKKVAI